MRRDTKQTADRTKLAMESVLSKMSPADLEVLVASLGEVSLEKAVEGQERALAQAQRAKLSADLAVAKQILGPPFQDSVANRDDERSLKTIRDQLEQIDAVVPAAAAIATLGDDGFADARAKLDDYLRLESWLEWETFADARRKLAVTQQRVVRQREEEEREAADKAERAEIQKVKARNAALMKAAASAEVGSGANVKCLMILPSGEHKIGKSGWLSSGRTLHPAVRSLLAKVRSKGDWDKDACAEVDALNRLMKAHYPDITSWDQIPKGIVSQALEARSRKGAMPAWYPRDACLNCRQWLEIIEASYVTS